MYTRWTGKGVEETPIEKAGIEHGSQVSIFKSQWYYYVTHTLNALVGQVVSQRVDRRSRIRTLPCEVRFAKCLPHHKFR